MFTLNKKIKEANGGDSRPFTTLTASCNHSQESWMKSQEETIKAAHSSLDKQQVSNT